MAVPVAVLVVGVNPTDPSGRTIRFTVTGAPSEIAWRFGDCTDHSSDPTGMDHTYDVDGTYPVIGVVGATGQRIIEDVTVPGT
jgi:PKD repeat protein